MNKYPIEIFWSDELAINQANPYRNPPNRYHDDCIKQVAGIKRKRNTEHQRYELSDFII